MKKNENRKPLVRMTESRPNNDATAVEENARDNMERLKKPLVFGLMGVVFLGCMYLIFKPSEDKEKVGGIGLNDAVPQATERGLQPDKQKAYELEMREQKEEEKRNALLSLSDYWTLESEEEEGFYTEEENYNYGTGRRNDQNPALSSYRSAQSTLGSFYQEESHETRELRQQLEELRDQLAGQQSEPANSVESQLAIMEESYKMAAKYLPTNSGDTDSGQNEAAAPSPSGQKEYFVAFTPTRKSAVSALYRETTDSSFIAAWSESHNPGFHTAGVKGHVVQPRNSIRAVVHETRTVTGESGLRLRLLEPAQTPHRTIPPGTLLTANAAFQNGRLQLKVSSIELDGNIIPVDIAVYDLDGQQGLFVPHSPEMNAVREIAANMGQTSGTSIMMTQSARQQIAADLSRGAIQGVSGYFSRKVRTPRVTVKAGHQVFLVSKS